MKRSLQDTEPTQDVDMDEVVDVDFDFFNLTDNDFLSIKHLLRQLFDVDNTRVNLSQLTEYLIEKSIGSTIKTDGEESDPFALFALCPDSPILDDLKKYWIEQTTETPALNRALRQVFADKKHSVGYLFSERLLNMPHEIVVPLYQILLNELKEEGVSYDYVVIPSRAYTEHESTLEVEEPKRKHREAPKEIFYYHIEDEFMSDFALASDSFVFETANDNTDAKRAFQELGIKPRGYLTVLKFKDLEKVLALEVLN